VRGVREARSAVQAGRGRVSVLTRRVHAYELDVLDAVFPRMHVLQHENARHGWSPVLTRTLGRRSDPTHLPAAQHGSRCGISQHPLLPVNCRRVVSLASFAPSLTSLAFLLPLGEYALWEA